MTNNSIAVMRWKLAKIFTNHDFDEGAHESSQVQDCAACRDEILELLTTHGLESRLDELLKMRAVGDKIAPQPGTDFEDLAGAYDVHILKRVADLTQ